MRQNESNLYFTTLYKYKTRVVKSTLSKKQLDKYTEVDGVLYFLGRLSKDNPFTFRDLDSVPFLDTHLFAGPVPVCLVD